MGAFMEVNTPDRGFPWKLMEVLVDGDAIEALYVQLPWKYAQLQCEKVFFNFAYMDIGEIFYGIFAYMEVDDIFDGSR